MRQTLDRVRVEISVVIPVYNEEEALPAFYRVLAEALDRLPQSAEIIFADDGSWDGSAATPRWEGLPAFDIASPDVVCRCSI